MSSMGWKGILGSHKLMVLDQGEGKGGGGGTVGFVTGALSEGMILSISGMAWSTVGPDSV